MNYIGIDFGTTNSSIAVYKDGNSEIIRDIEEKGSSTIPSIVMVEDGITYVGQKAKNQMILKPDNVISEVKRYMGTEKDINLEGKRYTTTEISAKIISKLKHMAEFYLGENIKEAVITIPTHFNNKVRVDLKKACTIAGLNIKNFINESTAAAIAYGFNGSKDKNNILVYDFGGGNIEVTIIEVFNGVFDVKSSRGLDIGGTDIDNIITKYIIETFCSMEKVRLDTDNHRIMSMIRIMAEECKKNLSEKDQYEIVIPYICCDNSGELKNLDVVLNRSDMNNLIKDIINRTFTLIDNVLDGAEMVDNDIDRVILVGGSTKLRLVRDIMINRFGTSKVVVGENTENSIVLGAAIDCALEGKGDSFNNSITIKDLSSHTLGSKIDSTIGSTDITNNEYIANEKVSNIDDVKVSIKDNIEDETRKIKVDCNDYKTQDIDVPKKAEVHKKVDVPKKVEVIKKVDAPEKNYIPEDIKIPEKVEIPEKIEIHEKVDVHEDIKSIKDNQVVEENKNDNNIQNDIEEDDYSTIYTEVAYLSKYVSGNLKNFDNTIQDNVKNYMADLLKYVKAGDFKSCRDIEHKVLIEMGIE